MATLETLEQDIKYIKEKVDDFTAMWKDHESRLQVLERANATDMGYARGRADAFNQSYKRQRVWIGVLSIVVAALTVIVAFKLH